MDSMRWIGALRADHDRPDSQARSRRLGQSIRRLGLPGRLRYRSRRSGMMNDLTKPISCSFVSCGVIVFRPDRFILIASIRAGTSDMSMARWGFLDLDDDL